MKRTTRHVGLDVHQATTIASVRGGPLLLRRLGQSKSEESSGIVKQYVVALLISQKVSICKRAERLLISAMLYPGIPGSPRSTVDHRWARALRGKGIALQGLPDPGTPHAIRPQHQAHR
jgi:hypothetical protein